MSARQVHRQVSEHGVEIAIHEDAENPHGYVEVCIVFNDDTDFDGPIYLSLRPEEARALADAVLSSSQRVSDRLPHSNS